MAIVDRSGFFLAIYGKAEGLACIATKQKQKFVERFFKYPEQFDAMLDYIDAIANTQDVWFCPTLMSSAKRTKSSAKLSPCAWADLDECSPDKLIIEPTIVVESSPQRWQAFWVFERAQDPQDAEELSRRIAYYHANEGCDKGCWDCARLLRVPKTRNNKYEDIVITEVRTFNRNRFRVEDFKEYPPTAEFDYLEVPFPDVGYLNSLGTGNEILDAKSHKISPAVWSLFYKEPESDWSKALWMLESELVEAGLELGEIYVVARDSACNKYARDNRDTRDLWKEVCRSFSRRDDTEGGPADAPKLITPLQLLSPEERKNIDLNGTFISRYMEWATRQSDASSNYHEAGAFILLSSILSGRVVLPTNFGKIYPNLWFMILGDTTLSRKSTSLDMAMDLLHEVDDNAILATDGTVEGLLGQLSQRPGQPSIFLRDEFSGMLESMVHKDYMAGMAEFFTKLYDGKMQKRVLRRETIEVHDPRLIMFVGGIKEKIAGLLTDEHVTSGFLPRFLFAVGKTDLSKIRGIGPPTEVSLEERDELVKELQQISNFYVSTQSIQVNGKTFQSPKTWEAKLTDDAWVRYNALESDLLKIGVEDEKPQIMTPVCDRMAKSALKVAVLMKAAEIGSKDDHEADLIVEEKDVIRAAYYAEKWFISTREVMGHVGNTFDERRMETIYMYVQREGAGVLRSRIMRNHKLTAREMDNIAQTLEQRGLIVRQRANKNNEVWEATGESSGSGKRRFKV